MTRAQFEAKVIRAAEKRLGIPAGWWGTWNDVTNGTVRVRLSSRLSWVLSCGGVRISRHDSRAFAIAKARRM